VRLLEQEQSGGELTGNAGLAPASGPSPAWQGFRPLRVSRKVRESSNVISLVLEPVDGDPLIAALPGQFIVLRLRPTPDVPALMRSYSLSGEPSAERYPVSVKREAHGAAGAYIDDRLQVGDVLDASAARGSFTLRPGDAPTYLCDGRAERGSATVVRPVLWLGPSATGPTRSMHRADGNVLICCWPAPGRRRH